MEINSKQSELITSQIETNRIANDTNKSTKRTSIAVAIFTSVAGIWYSHDLIYKLIPEKNDHRELLSFLTMISLGIVSYTIYILLIRLLKYRIKKGQL